MGESVYLQYPLVGGLDEKTAATYLDPQQNQSSITNGSFRYVGAINKRYGIHYDTALSTAALLNPVAISDEAPYVNTATYSTSLGGLGAVALQAGWAWMLKDNTVAFAGQLPNASVVRRPLAIHSIAAPLFCDGVVALQGTVRAGVWVSAPDVPVGTSNFEISSAFFDSSTSQKLLDFPTFTITGTNVTLINLVWFPNTGILALFLVVEAASSASRELRAYTVTPANSSNQWTQQAGATLSLYNSDTTSLDVQPLMGDPSDGYLVLYLTAADATTFHWRYFISFASVSTGALATGSAPGDFPCHIVADWGVDCVFIWSDNPGGAGTDYLYLDYYTADGLFTSIATYNNPPSSTAALGSFAYVSWQLGGACRVYTKTDAAQNSAVYLAFWAQDTTYYSTGGPSMPVTMGGIVARSTSTTITPMGFVYYPYGLIPIARPVQLADNLQIAGSFAHITHPCAQDYMLFTADSVPIANVTAADPVCQQVTEYVVDYRVKASGSPTSISTAQTTIVGTIAPRQLDPYLERWSNSTFLPICASADRTKAITPISIAVSGIAGTGFDIPVQWLAEISTVTTKPQSTTINDGVELSGGVPMRLGPTLYEHGFVNFPEFVTTSTGAGTLTGTYSYAVCYMRQDSNGNVERSSPAVLAAPISVTSKQVSIHFPKLAWDNANDQVLYFVELYRTLNGGSTYYCVSRTQAGNFASGPYGGVVDEMADATLQKAAILYTTGGLLDNVNPPAAAYCVSHRGRYAIADDTRQSVWFTKTETSGEVMGFNEALISPFIEGGDITAIASLDDKFVVFKSDSIWIQFGDGPADNGQNSDWTTPQLVPSDVGCTSAASVSAAPAGIMFLSRAGFHMLSRGLSVEFVGKGVQDTVAAYPTCIASVAVPAQKQIRWVMQAAGGAQIVLVYDYFLNMWTKHVYSNLDSAIVDVFMVDGVYTVLTTNGTRYVESASSYLDTDTASATHFVPLTVVTPWVKISGAQGYQRSRRVLSYAVMNDPCNLTVSLAFNYDATVQQTKTWTYAAFEATGAAQAELHTAAQWNKCEALQVTLADASSASAVTGQGMTFEAVAFDLDKIGERYHRLPARLKG